MNTFQGSLNKIYKSSLKPTVNLKVDLFNLDFTKSIFTKIRQLFRHSEKLNLFNYYLLPSTSITV